MAELSRRDAVTAGLAFLGYLTGLTDPTAGIGSMLVGGPLSTKKELGLLRAFFGGLAFGGMTKASTSCGTAPESRRSPDTGPQTSPSLAFYSAITGISATTEHGVGLETIIGNSEQMDWFLSSLASNWRRTSQIEQVQAAINQGNAFGWSDCPDSRITIPDIVPGTNLPDFSPNFIAGNGTAGYGVTVDGAGRLINYQVVVEGGTSGLPDWVTRSYPPQAVYEARQIGAQPSLFPAGVNQSVFLTHEALPSCGTGCGFLGGVDELIKNPQLGIGVLRNHGVPEETIGFIESWITSNSYRFPDLDNITPETWSRIGAEMQSYINYQKYQKGHFVLYGVRAHGTESARVLGVVGYDDLGRLVELDPSEVPVLQGAIDFINQPHPAIEALVKGQQPGINVISTSRRTPSQLFGEFNQGEAFVVSHDASSLTTGSLEDLMTGAGYSAGALTQRGKIIELVADSEIEMAKLRQAFLGTTYADDWFREGGLLVELIPDETTGLFRRTIVLRNAENPSGALLTLSADEQVLVENGVTKLVAGTIRTIEVAGGETILVRVQSAADGKIYELSIPKSSAYSAITAETLEKAGLPAIEALWWEKSLAKLTKVLGPVAIVAGLAWMAYDGINWAIDTMDLDRSVQLLNKGTLPKIPNQELLQVIANKGMDHTVANTVFEGGSIGQTQNELIRRITASQLAGNVGIDMEIPFSIRLDDDTQVGIPALVTDEDTPTPIRVSCKYQTYETEPYIYEITYSNKDTGEAMVFQKQPDASFALVSGPELFEFSAIVTPPSYPGEHYAIPLKFSFANGVETVEPNYK